MEHISAAEARARKGVRLVVTRDIPVPWSEGAKSILYVKGIEHVRVYHVAGQDDPELIEWTGIKNAPILIVDDEPALDGWAQILLRLERLQPEPRLIPADEKQRMEMFGIMHELLGPDGFIWNRRIWLNERAASSANAIASKEVLEGLLKKYGNLHCGDPVLRIVAILRRVSEVLRAQKDAGSRYFIGDRITALDVYWAAAAALVKPLPDDLCAMHETLRAAYTEHIPEVLAVVDPLLLEHRDYIYNKYLELPVRL